MKCMLQALDPYRLSDEDVPVDYVSNILPNVLCPWGCSEFCFRAKMWSPIYIVQEQLPKVVLNFLRTRYYRDMFTSETSRVDYIPKDGEKPSQFFSRKQIPNHANNDF